MAYRGAGWRVRGTSVGKGVAVTGGIVGKATCVGVGVGVCASIATNNNQQPAKDRSARTRHPAIRVGLRINLLTEAVPLETAKNRREQHSGECETDAHADENSY
jgi:hypothetical protein